jgi:2-polyprenyl-6-methoxyphenol hydroxylase-like FAD-dependent oxidoreductase
MSKPHILISGASVAGPALAYWLVRAGCRITVVERAPALRSTGQGIDIRDSARDVVKKMGIFGQIRERSSKEEGTEFISGNHRLIARFPVDLESGNSMTSDVEILRGELARILYEVTKDDVKYVFGDMVESLDELADGIRVGFANGTPAETFDLVVAADGIGSKIRRMVFGRDAPNVKSLNSYVSYFSIPRIDTDTMWSRAYWVPGGRCTFLRPDNIGRTRAFLTVTAYDGSDPRLARFEKVVKEGIPAQKELVTEMFSDIGWEVPRVLDALRESDDFYMQQVVQLRMKAWSKGRVSLVGDSGYAPSPFTGMGTSLAFIGAYVLAGEISKQVDNIPAALEEYEKVLRPYVEDVQNLPWGIPWIVNPQSAWGVKVFETFIWGLGILENTGVLGLFSKAAKYLPSRGEKFKLPEYEAFKK